MEVGDSVWFKNPQFKDSRVDPVWIPADISKKQRNEDNGNWIVTLRQVDLPVYQDSEHKSNDAPLQYFQTRRIDTNLLKAEILNGVEETEELKTRLALKGIFVRTDDLNNLPSTTEPTILHMLYQRLNHDQIFTLSGRTLLVLNPFDLIRPFRRRPQFIRKFVNKIRTEASIAITSNQYASQIMKRFEPPLRSILISGESGSGKTCTAKMILQAFVHHHAAGGVSSAVGHYKEEKKEEASMHHILKALSVLQSIGNAQTANTENSSRYGLLIDLEVNSRGLVTNTTIRTYLLEAARTVYQMEGEKNFNIFYQLLAGCTIKERRKLHLDRTEYAYARDSSKEDNKLHEKHVAGLQEFKTAVLSLGLTEETLQAFFQILAAILALGDIKFKDQNIAGTVGCVIINEDRLADAANLLDVSEEKLKELLTFKSFATPRGESISRPLNAELAAISRDAVAKALYKGLFDHVVNNINVELRTQQLQQQQQQVLQQRLTTRSSSFTMSGGNLVGGSNENSNNKKRGGLLKSTHNKLNQQTTSCNSIYLVDIFGFDSFPINSLEQLCINYANETLQQLFNYHLFKLEMKVYENEAIIYDPLQFRDNQANIDLISNGIFSILDDQCRLPNPTDKRFLGVLYKELEPNRLFKGTKNQILVNKFSIMHFAGEVEYTGNNIIVRNMDNFPANTSVILKASSNVIIQALISPTALISSGSKRRALPAYNTPLGGGVGKAEESVKIPADEGKRGRSTSPGSKQRGNNQFASFVSQVKADLHLLIEEIKHSTPHYVRCMKPFDRDQFTTREDGVIFNQKKVLEELNFGGVLEAIQISHTGFHTRMEYDDFYSKYRAAFSSRERNGMKQMIGKHMSNEVLADRYEQSFPKNIDHAVSRQAKQDICVALIEAICETFQIKPPIQTSAMQFGKTLIFLKRAEFQALEDVRDISLQNYTKKVARCVYGHYCRCLFLRKRTASIMIQKYIRRYLSIMFVKRMKLVILAVVTLQRRYRRAKFYHSVVIIQAFIRRYHDRLQYLLIKNAREKLLKLYGPFMIARELRFKRRLLLDEQMQTVDPEKVNLEDMEQRLNKYQVLENSLREKVNDLIVGEANNQNESIVDAAGNNSEFSEMLRKLYQYTKDMHACELETYLKHVMKKIRPAHMLLKTKALAADASYVGKLFGPAMWKMVGMTVENDCKPIELHPDHKLFERIHHVLVILKELETLAAGELMILEQERSRLRYQETALRQVDNMQSKTHQELEEIAKQMKTVRYVETAVYLLVKYYHAFIGKFIQEYGMHSLIKSKASTNSEYLRRLLEAIRLLKRGVIKLNYNKPNSSTAVMNVPGMMTVSSAVTATSSVIVEDNSSLILRLEWEEKMDALDLTKAHDHDFDIFTHLEEKEFGLVKKMYELEQKKREFMNRHLRITEIDEVGYVYSPVAPGVGASINSLFTLLGKSLSTVSRLIKVTDRTTKYHPSVSLASAAAAAAKASVFYQAVLGMHRKSFVEILYNPILVESIEERSFSAAMITCCLLNLTHLQPNHLLVSMSESNALGNKIVRIEAFNNDATLTAHYYQEDESYEQLEAHHKLDLNVLFAMPQMDEPIDAELQALLRKPLFPEEFVSAWLRELHEQNERWHREVKEDKTNHFTKADFIKLRIPIRLPVNAAVHLLEKINILQSVVCQYDDILIEDLANEGYQINHRDVLEALYPDLSDYYTELRERSEFVSENMAIDGLASHAFAYHQALDKLKKEKNFQATHREHNSDSDEDEEGADGGNEHTDGHGQKSLKKSKKDKSHKSDKHGGDTEKHGKAFKKSSALLVARQKKQSALMDIDAMLEIEQQQQNNSSFHTKDSFRNDGSHFGDKATEEASGIIPVERKVYNSFFQPRASAILQAKKNRTGSYVADPKDDSRNKQQTATNSGLSELDDIPIVADEEDAVHNPIGGTAGNKKPSVTRSKTLSKDQNDIKPGSKEEEAVAEASGVVTGATTGRVRALITAADKNTDHSATAAVPVSPVSVERLAPKHKRSSVNFPQMPATPQSPSAAMSTSAAPLKSPTSTQSISSPRHAPSRALSAVPIIEEPPPRPELSRIDSKDRAQQTLRERLKKLMSSRVVTRYGPSMMELQDIYENSLLGSSSPQWYLTNNTAASANGGGGSNKKSMNNLSPGDAHDLEDLYAGYGGESEEVSSFFVKSQAPLREFKNLLQQQQGAQRSSLKLNVDGHNNANGGQQEEKAASELLPTRQIVLEIAKKEFSSNPYGAADMKDISVAEAAFDFLRTIDWRFFEEIEPRSRAIEVCKTLGKHLAFLPSLWLNYINEWQLRAFFQYWLQYYSYRYNENNTSSVRLSTCEIVLHFHSAVNIEEIKEWKVLKKLQKKLHLDIKFAISTVVHTKNTPNRGGSGIGGGSGTVVSTNRHGAERLQYDLYSYHMSFAPEEEDDEMIDKEIDEDSDLEDENNIQLKTNLKLRRKLLKVVFTCTNLLAEEDIHKLEQDVSILKEIIYNVALEEEKDMDAYLLKYFSMLVVEFPGLSMIGKTMAERRKYSRDKSIIHSLLSHPLVERYVDFILALLHAHPELLLFVDKQRSYLPCDAIKRIDDRKKMKYPLLCTFVNFAAEPSQRHFQTMTPQTSDVSMTNARGIFSSYRGEEELIVCAAHFDLPATSVEFRQRRYDMLKRDTLYNERLLYRLLIAEINGDAATRSFAIHTYELLSKAIKERIVSHFIFGETGEDWLWSSLDLENRTAEEKAKFNLIPQQLDHSVIMRLLHDNWRRGTHGHGFHKPHGHGHAIS